MLKFFALLCAISLTASLVTSSPVDLRKQIIGNADNPQVKSTENNPQGESNQACPPDSSNGNACTTPSTVAVHVSTPTATVTNAAIKKVRAHKAGTQTAHTTATEAVHQIVTPTVHKVTTETGDKLASSTATETIHKGGPKENVNETVHQTTTEPVSTNATAIVTEPIYQTVTATVYPVITEPVSRISFATETMRPVVTETVSSIATEAVSHTVTERVATESVHNRVNKTIEEVVTKTIYTVRVSQHAVSQTDVRTTTVSTETATEAVPADIAAAETATVVATTKTQTSGHQGSDTVTKTVDNKVSEKVQEPVIGDLPLVSTMTVHVTVTAYQNTDTKEVVTTTETVSACANSPPYEAGAACNSPIGYPITSYTVADTEVAPTTIGDAYTANLGDEKPPVMKEAMATQTMPAPVSSTEGMETSDVTVPSVVLPDITSVPGQLDTNVSNNTILAQAEDSTELAVVSMTPAGTDFLADIMAELNDVEYSVSLESYMTSVGAAETETTETESTAYSNATETVPAGPPVITDWPGPDEF